MDSWGSLQGYANRVSPLSPCFVAPCHADSLARVYHVPMQGAYRNVHVLPHRRESAEHVHTDGPLPCLQERSRGGAGAAPCQHCRGSSEQPGRKVASGLGMDAVGGRGQARWGNLCALSCPATHCLHSGRSLFTYTFLSISLSPSLPLFLPFPVSLSLPLSPSLSLSSSLSLYDVHAVPRRRTLWTCSCRCTSVTACIPSVS